MTSSIPFDSLGKRAVREMWNTPLLRFINEELGIRFRYMGLPGVDLLDVKLWRDMIDHVIAFEVPPRNSRGDDQRRRNILALRRNLQLLGVPGHAYFGPMEEVIVLGRDYDGNRYFQDKVITLYNLDFCDEIASRISTKEQGEQIWRFEAIRQILRDQRQAFQRHGGPCYFILLLTVRDQINSEKLRGFLAGNLFDDTRAYLEACGGIRSLPDRGPLMGTHTWALKAFIHNAIRQYLTNPNISATFFPLVRYLGTPVQTSNGSIPSPMLHCMIMCRFEDHQSPFPSCLPEDYLASVSTVRVSDQGHLVWDSQLGESLTRTGNPSSSMWFQEQGLCFLQNR